MAKSLRSKRARKMRAIKRVRYGAKELTRLQNMITKTELEEAESSETNVGFKLVSPPSASDEASEAMELEGKVIDPKTLKDQVGNYAEWVNQKRIKRIKRSRKRQGKKGLKKKKN